MIEPDLTQQIPETIERVHFIGIGGSGMSGIAHMMLDAGIAVVSVTHDQEFSDVLGGTELKLGAPELKFAGQEPGLRNPEVAAP